jgi:hypothetical protein
MTVEERLARIETLLGNGLSSDVAEIKCDVKTLVAKQTADSERIARLEERQTRTAGILAIAQVIGTGLGMWFGGREA